MLVIITKKLKKLKFGKIRLKLVATYIGIIVLTLVFISAYILAAVSQYLYNDAKVSTLSKANMIANVVSDYIAADPDEIPYVLNRLDIGDTTRVIISDSYARVIYDTSTDRNLYGKIFLNAEMISALKGKDLVNVYKYDNGNSINCAASVIISSENVGVVYVTNVTTTTDNFINELKWIFMVISLVVIILVGVFSSIMADIVVGPIERLTMLIKKMESVSLSEKVPVKGNDEIAQLSEAFNTLTDKLDEMEEKRRLFVSNASHELKTPLSSIKLLSESICSMDPLNDEYVKEFMGDINGEIDRLTKIIDRLLQLTKLDSKKDLLDKKISDINEMTERIVKSLTPVAESKNIDLKLHTKHEVLAMVDREKIWQVIYNLTDNAIKYTPNGGIVSLFVFNEGDNCRVEVEDNGIGIPEGETEQVFDRFYRVDKARSRASGGTGLGLSIVKETVLLHNGTVYCESKENQGTKFTVILPKGLTTGKEDI